MSRISEDKSDKSTITSNGYVSNYKKNGTVTFFSEGVIQVDDNSSLCEGLTKSGFSTIEYLENLEKENAQLKLHLEIAHKFYEELLNEIPEGLAEWKGLSLKDMTDYYLKKLEQLKEQGEWVFHFITLRKGLFTM